MNCPNCPKPSAVNSGTLAVPGCVPSCLGQINKVIYNNNNEIYKLSHCPTHTGVGTVGTLRKWAGRKFKTALREQI